MPNLSSWKINEDDYPEKGSIEERIKFILRYAILAPSGHNTQPWKVSIHGNKIRLRPDRSRHLRVMDPDMREFYISQGTFLANLKVAAEYFGFRVDQNPTWEVGLREGGKKGKNKKLFSAITHRRNNRDDYKNKKIDEKILAGWRRYARDGIDLFTIADEEKKRELAEVTAKALMLDFSRKDFRQEIASWIRSNINPARDGIPVYTTDMKVPSLLASLFLKYVDIGRLKSRKDSKKIAASPVVCILASRNDEIETWIKVGEIFECLALDATSRGITLAIFASSIEADGFYWDISKELNTKLRPQMFFTAGFPKRLKMHAPRRSLEDFII